MKFNSKLSEFSKWSALGLCLGMVFGIQPAKAQVNCNEMAGEWAGQMKGAYRGATSMKLKNNCRLSWKLPDGRTNRCRYKNKGNEIQYSCSLGSKGTVVINGKRITMQNKYTAHKHGAYTVNFKKAGN